MVAPTTPRTSRAEKGMLGLGRCNHTREDRVVMSAQVLGLNNRICSS